MNGLKEKRLSSSLEDYLEAISYLEKANRVARVKDIAKLLKVKMPSVTGALKILKEKGLVDHEKNSYICLTDRGLRIANAVTRKHSILTHFLENILHIPNLKAQEMACQMEHILDGDALSRIMRLIDTFESEVIGKDRLSSEDWEKIVAGRKDEDGLACLDDLDIKERLHLS